MLDADLKGITRKWWCDDMRWMDMCGRWSCSSHEILAIDDSATNVFLRHFSALPISLISALYMWFSVGQGRSGTRFMAHGSPTKLHMCFLVLSYRQWKSLMKNWCLEVGFKEDCPWKWRDFCRWSSIGPASKKFIFTGGTTLPLPVEMIRLN